MKIKTSLILASIVALLFNIQCKREVNTYPEIEKKSEKTENQDGISENKNTQFDELTVDNEPETKVSTIEEKNAVQFQELTIEDGFDIDLRYATKNNFTKQKIYDCARCYLRPEVAENLLKAKEELQQKFGYSIKLFDCFRPRPYQQKLWDIVPDADYVTPPSKGSMHSKGLAVDLTLIDKNGDELDMGTPFDFFGKEAHYDYPHTDAIKRNRWILKSTLEKFGFGGIRTEWWHFSYRKTAYPLDDWVWECNE